MISCYYSLLSLVAKGKAKGTMRGDIGMGDGLFSSRYGIPNTKPKPARAIRIIGDFNMEVSSTIDSCQLHPRFPMSKRHGREGDSVHPPLFS